MSALKDGLGFIYSLCFSCNASFKYTLNLKNSQFYIFNTLEMKYILLNRKNTDLSKTEKSIKNIVVSTYPDLLNIELAIFILSLAKLDL